MFQQLVQRLVLANGVPPAQAASSVLTADPMDLVLYMEQVWRDAAISGPAGKARTTLMATGDLAGLPASPQPPWDHLGYAFALENTRAVQILARVVREFRSGEALGIPSLATQRWLDATEALLFGAGNLFAAWTSTSLVRPDPEAVRRNAYWRMFGMDLAFGTEANSPFPYAKAAAANTTFVAMFEELLYELWQAISNIRNSSGQNQADDDRIYRLAEQLGQLLRSRRLANLLAREELSAVAALGWVELTLSADTPVVVDLRANAPSAAERLRLIGQKVDLPAHSKSFAFFSMANELSLLLKALEANLVSEQGLAWLLYAPAPPPGAAPLPAGARPLDQESRRVITEWSAASGKDLKVRKLAIQTAPRPGEGTRRNGQSAALTGR
ncbi:hypothetical protein [Granulicoccus phenolivorans]|uniref:hypothetical protein n=1 Tax=Granulicoccus phenolivorans TaxID=266854 RepID=UPI00040B2108|nr:hypothetical protein [Granulicoccus phenolivorans]